jgi:hypothetical protein
MALDARLDLGRYIQNPFNRSGKIAKQLDFNDLFASKPETGEYPWNPSRFNERDLLKRMMTRKMKLNPELNYVDGNSPFFDDNSEVTPAYDMFGNGRFNRPEDYDFAEGRPNTQLRPQQQPDFNPQWVEAYKLSPTVKPDKVAKNPMPRLKNPDPNGYLMAMAEKRAENEAEDNKSIADLIQKKSTQTPGAEKQEEKAGEKTADENKAEPNVSPGKTLNNVG